MWRQEKSEPKRPATEEGAGPSEENGNTAAGSRAESGEDIIAFVGKGV